MDGILLWLIEIIKNNVFKPNYSNFISFNNAGIFIYNSNLSFLKRSLITHLNGNKVRVLNKNSDYFKGFLSDLKRVFCWNFVLEGY